MHPYIPHLLSDIASAQRIEPEAAVYPQTFEEEMEEIERWVAGEEPLYSFGYYCGLNPAQFPPSAQLSNEEMALVNKALRKMMFTWNLDASFPSDLPIPFTYDLLVKTLNEKTSIPNSGFMCFDYCSGYAPDCIFKEYCSCLQYWNNKVDDMDDLPSTGMR